MIYLCLSTKDEDKFRKFTYRTDRTLPRFEALDDYSEASIETVIMSYIKEKGIKNGQGLWPVRTAVSGKQSTPGGAYEIMSLLGKEESLRRIRIAIDKLSKAVNN